MNLFLTHIDWSPIIYGICLFLSVMSMAWKIKRNNYFAFFAEVLVVGLILLIHGGSVTGGFAATIAGLLSGWCLPLVFNTSSTASSTPDSSAPARTVPGLTKAEAYQIWRSHQPSS